MPWTLRELELQARSNLLREELWENSCFIINPWNFLQGNKTQLLKLFSKTLIKDTDAGGTWSVGPWNRIHQHHVLQDLLEDLWEPRRTKNWHACSLHRKKVNNVWPKINILSSTRPHVIPDLAFVFKCWRNFWMMTFKLQKGHKSTENMSWSS